MERFELLKDVGEGSYGNVYRAINKKTKEVVAIKKMKKNYCSWNQCLNDKEFKSLRKLKHPNIVKLKEVILENDISFFVFEWMDLNLRQLMKIKPELFSQSAVRNLCFQLFHGIAYMHETGFFHRDIKPDNLLVSKGLLKIADFGSAREINSMLPYTVYVTTRWYRAPEVLLRSSIYSSKVDMWALGTIMAEMLTCKPLFPGSVEADQMSKICSVLGTPTLESWPDGIQFATNMKFQFPQFPGVKLSKLIRSASDDAIDLISVRKFCCDARD